jgi:ubiquitin-conjugating enzyme E2 H
MAWRRRIARDIKDLLDNGYKVTSESGDDEYKLDSFVTILKGPVDCPYSGSSWQLRFTIPDGFPFSSPSVGFVQRIFHPNVDEESGTICLDALNKAWSPSFTIRHIVETVLPYLLSYPNPDDPLNRDAAHLMKTNKEAFDARVRAHCQTHALKV